MECSETIKYMITKNLKTLASQQICLLNFIVVDIHIILLLIIISKIYEEILWYCSTCVVDNNIKNE